MKLKRYLVLIILIIAVGCSNNEQTLPDENIFFSTLDADYHVQTTSPENINVILLEANSSKLLKELKNVSINNNDLILTDFDVKEGDMVQNKYTLMNLELEVRSDKEGTFSFDEVTLIFNDDSELKRNIGNVSISVSEENIRNNSNLLPPSDYIVSYPALDFTTELKNNTTQDIYIDGITENNKGLEFEDITVTKDNQEVDVIKPNETVQLKASVKKVKDYQFYVTTPVVTYKLGNDDSKEVYLPTVMYGYMDINDTTVKEIVQK